MKVYFIAVIVVALSTLVGCKTEIGGSTRPNDPDVHYFPRGQEFKLTPSDETSFDVS